MLEVPELWRICQGELWTGIGDSPREREKCAAVSEVRRVEPSKPFGMKLLLAFSLALAHHFLTLPPISPFWNGNGYVESM